MTSKFQPLSPQVCSPLLNIDEDFGKYFVAHPIHRWSAGIREPATWQNFFTVFLLQIVGNWIPYNQQLKISNLSFSDIFSLYFCALNACNHAVLILSPTNEVVFKIMNVDVNWLIPRASQVSTGFNWPSSVSFYESLTFLNLPVNCTSKLHALH